MYHCDNCKNKYGKNCPVNRATQNRLLEGCEFFGVIKCRFHQEEELKNKISDLESSLKITNPISIEFIFDEYMNRKHPTVIKVNMINQYIEFFIHNQHIRQEFVSLVDMQRTIEMLRLVLKDFCQIKFI